MTLTVSRPFVTEEKKQRPNDPEAVAFLNDKTQFGRVIVKYSETASVFLNRQPEFISYETRTQLYGEHRVTKKPFTRWQQRSIVIVKVKNQRMQTFVVERGQTKNLTNHLPFSHLVEDENQINSELLALASRNNLDLSGIPLLSEQENPYPFPLASLNVTSLAHAFAYPPTRYVKHSSILPTPVPTCLAELFRSKDTVEEVFHHVTNTPEGELRELLNTTLLNERPLTAERFYELCWALTTTKGILTATARFHMVAGMLQADIIPDEGEPARWRLLGNIISNHSAKSADMPSLKSHRELRKLMKHARDQHGPDGLWKTTLAVLHKPKAVAGTLLGFSQKVVAEQIVATIPLTATIWTEKLLALDVTQFDPDEPLQDTKDLERFFQRLARSKVFSIKSSEKGQALTCEQWDVNEKKIVSATVAGITYPPAEGSKTRKRRFKNIPEATLIHMTGGLKRPEAVYPRRVLEKLSAVWNETEDLMEAANVPISETSVALVFAWRLRNNFQKPTRRVLRLSSYGLVTPVFLRMAETRQKVSDAEVLAGLPTAFAMPLVQ